MDIIDKKKYIFNKLSNNNYHNNVINFIITNNIKYTENSNSLLINLSVLQDNLVDKLYDLLLYDNVDNDIYHTNLLKKIDTVNENNHIEKNKKKEIIINDIDISLFSEHERNIILLSKKYKFE